MEKVKLKISNIERIIFIVIMVSMALILISHVTLRYVFNKPLIWSDEVASLLQGTMTFLGIGYCFTRKQHISLSLVYDRVPPVVQAILDIITNLIMLVCLAIMVRVGFKYVSNQMVQLGTVSWLYKSYFYVFIPIGFIIAIFHVLERLISAIKRIHLLMKGD